MCTPFCRRTSHRPHNVIVSPARPLFGQLVLPLQRAVRSTLWRVSQRVHAWEYSVLLPGLARLPLGWGYAGAAARGWINAALRKDWRSMALRTRHIARMSEQAVCELIDRRVVSGQRVGGVPRELSQPWIAQRFRTEARDEFEAWLMDQERWGALQCRFEPPDAPERLRQALEDRGLVLLTPHFDSFYLGIAFLAQASGCTVHAMASAVPSDPRVDAAVTRHFERKYRGLEKALRGGHVMNMEDGLRPFYRVLDAREALVVLADAPVLEGGAAMNVDFLGARRRLAGGPLRLARHAEARLAAFVCRYEGSGRYVLQWHDSGPAEEATMDTLYAFLGSAIAAEPGRWWAMDMLPNLPCMQDHQTAVILVNYRDAEEIERAVNSLRQGPQGWVGRVWVIDNSECQKQADALSALAQRDGRLVLDVAERNLGFGGACNRAYVRLRAEAPEVNAVFLLNPDARITARALRRLVDALHSHPEWGAVSPRTWWDAIGGWLLPCPTPQAPGPARARRTQALALGPSAWACQEAEATRRQMMGDVPIEVSGLAGAALLLRCEAVDRLADSQPFDPNYFMYFEDAELSQRLLDAGWRLAIDPQVDAVHQWRHAPHKAGLMAAAHQRYRARWSTADWAWESTDPIPSPLDAGPDTLLQSVEQAVAVVGPVRALSPSNTGDPAWVRCDGNFRVLTAAEWQLLAPGGYWAWTMNGWCSFTKDDDAGSAD